MTQIQIEAASLAKAFASIKSIPDKKSTIPILAMCVVEAGNGRMTLTASNMEIQSTVVADCDGVLKPICVPAYLLEAGGRLAGKTVTIEVKDKDVIVKAGRARYSGQWMPAQDYPDMGGEFDAEGEIEAGALATIIKATTPAVWIHDDRQYLQGVCIEIEDGHLVATATDGHRVHNCRVEARGLSLPAQLIVPPQTCAEVLRLCSAASPIRVRASTRMIEFSTERERLVSKLIAGTFPDWRRIIPAPSGTSITTDVGEALTAMERVIRVFEDGGVQLTGARGRTGSGIRLTEDGDWLAISAPVGAEDAIAATFEGDVGFRGVSGKYLRDALAVAKDRGWETICLDAPDATSPIRCFNPSDPLFTATVMPFWVGGAQ